MERLSVPEACKLAPMKRLVELNSVNRIIPRADIRPGEVYRLRMDPEHVGTMWWCWGDLEGELKGKPFSEWRHGWDGYSFGVVKPEPDVVERKGGY